MLKVLIVDDEKHICDLIFHLIDWNSLDLEVVGMAYNGVDAHEKLLEYRPEIVITDIRMPGFDGISLIEKTKKENIETEFIIISGYKEFEYARKGIEYGVSSYLLKPIQQSELNAALEKAKINYNEKIEIESSFSEKSKSMIDMTISEIEEKKKIAFTGIPVVFTMQITSHKLMSSAEYDIIFEKISNLLYSKVNIVIEESPYFHIISDRDKTLIIRDIKKTEEDISENFHIFYTYKKYEGNKIGSDIQENMEVLNNRFAFNDFVPEKKEKEIKIADRILNSKKVENAVSILSLEMMQIEFNDILENLISEKAAESEIIEFVHWYINLINDSISALGNEHESYIDIQKISHEIKTSSNTDDLYTVFSETIFKHVEDILEHVKQKQSMPVKLAKEIINTRYMEPLNLNDIAGEVQLNPSYLSVLFKKETGYNFTDYLIEYRLERAKEMLAETNKNINEISLQVGYKDTKHFRNLFRKYVGTTPSQYRALFS